MSSTNNNNNKQQKNLGEMGGLELEEGEIYSPPPSPSPSLIEELVNSSQPPMKKPKKEKEYEEGEITSSSSESEPESESEKNEEKSNLEKKENDKTAPTKPAKKYFPWKNRKPYEVDYSQGEKILKVFEMDTARYLLGSDIESRGFVIQANLPYQKNTDSKTYSYVYCFQQGVIRTINRGEDKGHHMKVGQLYSFSYNDTKLIRKKSRSVEKSLQNRALGNILTVTTHTPKPIEDEEIELLAIGNTTKAKLSFMLEQVNFDCGPMALVRLPYVNTVAIPNPLSDNLAKLKKENYRYEVLVIVGAMYNFIEQMGKNGLDHTNTVFEVEEVLEIYEIATQGRVGAPKTRKLLWTKAPRQNKELNEVEPENPEFYDPYA